RQGDGTIVLDWRHGGEIALLPQFLSEEVPASERFDAVMTLVKLRQRLLDEALDLAATQAHAEDLAAIHEAIGALREARGGDSAAADAEVDRGLAAAARDLVVTWTFNTFERVFVALGERFSELWRNDAGYVDALGRIVRALEAKSGARAREELRQAGD